jgi:hypothetical protein
MCLIADFRLTILDWRLQPAGTLRPLAIRHVEPTTFLEVAEPPAKHPELCPKDSFGETAKLKT